VNKPGPSHFIHAQVSIEDVFRLRRADIVNQLVILVPLGNPRPDSPVLNALNGEDRPPDAFLTEVMRRQSQNVRLCLCPGPNCSF